MAEQVGPMEKHVPTLPDEKTGRRVVTDVALEAGSAAIPFVGGSLAVILAHAFSRSYEKRLRAWMEELAEAVQELYDSEGVDIEALAEDETFLDAVATATRIAEKSGSDIKRTCLKNALFNIGVEPSLDGDKRLIYLRYVDELTPSHIQVLGFFNDPVKAVSDVGQAWPNIMGGLSSIVKIALPDLHADEALLNTIVGDLDRQGLVSSPGLSTMMTENGLKTSRTTVKGREFMAFVSTPFRLSSADNE